MTILTTDNISGALAPSYLVVSLLHEPHQSAAVAALGRSSPVDTAVELAEALYAAVKQDAALVGDALTKVVSACAQAAHIVTIYQWHGKAQRCAAMSVALNLINDGTAISAAGGPDVDAQFAPPPPAPSV